MRHDGGLRIRGTAAQIIEVSNQIRKLRELPIGGFAQLDDFELTVADRPSRFNKRIAMPADAWKYNGFEVHRGRHRMGGISTRLQRLWLSISEAGY